MTEFERFLELWDMEAEKTAKLMRALPADQYDFRPDAGGRSIGEMAWHLAEGDAYNSFGIESGGFFDPGMKPPGIARPRTVAELAPGYERIHADAKARIQKLRPEDLERKIKYFDGADRTVLDILWNLLLHLVHHRGQLSMLCRQSGGVSPGMYGPNREEMAALRAAAGI